MDATLDQLQSVEGIDNEMAIQILEVRDASHFIDFNAVSGITGVPKSRNISLNLACYSFIRNYIMI